MVGARPASRPALGVTLDPSEDPVPRTVMEGEICARVDGTFVAGDNERRDSKSVQCLVDGGLDLRDPRRRVLRIERVQTQVLRGWGRLRVGEWI